LAPDFQYIAAENSPFCHKKNFNEVDPFAIDWIPC